MCILCLKKADREATQRQIESISNHTNRLQSGSNDSDEIFPTGICTTCRVDLVNDLGKPGVSVPDVPRFISFRQNVVISQDEQGKCQCLLCKIATCKGLEYHPLY